ncbi:MAG: hypothetical protein AB7E79_01195 [Rhodospirillaceae bacterium]
MTPEPHALTWEDADPADGRWWLARAREVTSAGVRDFFIAEDDMTEALLGLLRVPPQSHYTVLAAAFLDRFESRAAAAASLKQDVSAALTQTDKAAAVRRALLYWRTVRVATILRQNLPFILLGLCGGMVLGLSVALFAVWTEFVGWPMVAAGVVLGAAAGVLLKMAVENYRAKAVAGPWGRFAVAMLGVIVGAGVTAVGALFRFWQ